MAFWGKQPTLTEQTEQAVYRIAGEIESLTFLKEDALSSFRSAAERLCCINRQLDENSALCGRLIDQLSKAQADIAQQVSDNEKVRGKILDIIGE